MKTFPFRRLFSFSLFLVSLTVAARAQAKLPEAAVDLNFQKELPAKNAGTAGGAVEVAPGGTQPPEHVSGGKPEEGAVRFAPGGRKGTGITLDASEDKLRLSAPGEEMTISAWIRLPEPSDSADTKGKQSLVSNLDPKETGGWMFGAYPGGSLFFYWTRSDASPTLRTTDALVTPGAWHHVAVTWTNDVSGGLQFFVDGAPALPKVGPTILRLKGTQPISASEEPLTIGATGDERYPFSGEIRSLQIYDKALGDEEIAQLAQTGS